MKKTLLILSFLLVLIGGLFGDVILQEDFETDGSGLRYTETGGFSDESSDYFLRTNGDSPSGVPSYTGSNNDWFYAAEDNQDGDNPNSDESYIIFNDVNIQNYSDLVIKGLFACGGQAKFDGPDYMHVYVNIDNSETWSLIGAFESDITGSNSSNFGLDADFNGLSDGPNYLDLAFEEYSFNVGNTGSVIDIKIEVFMTSGSEEVAFDNIRLEGSLSTPSTAPSITNIAHTPETPNSLETVTVSATITDTDGIFGAELHYGTTSGNLTSSVNMTNDGDTYSGIIPANFSNTDVIYYEVYAMDNNLEETTSSEYSYTVTDPVTTTLPYSEDFASGFGDAMTYSVSGATKEWINDSGTAAMNGYNSGDLEEDWLILPGINLNNTSNEEMTFTSWYKYGSDDANNYLKLMYSTNYSGSGSPAAADWTELTYNAPSSAETTDDSGTIELNSISGDLVWIAFKYNYNSGSYRSWKIDDISIVSVAVEPTLTVNPSTLSGFSYEIGAGPSDSQSFTVSGDNLEANVFVAPTTNYEISSNNTDFQSTSIELTQAGGTLAETTIYTRLKAGLSVADYNSEVIDITSTNAVSQEVTCSGSVTSSDPVISDITANPSENIYSNTTVHVSASVNDTQGVGAVELQWNITNDFTDSENYDTITMSLPSKMRRTTKELQKNISRATYTTETPIPAQNDGETVYYRVYAIDNNLNETTSPEQSYVVTNPAAIAANFEANTITTYVGSSVSFTNTSTGGFNPDFLWSFGDGSEGSLEENPIHTYNAIGTYTVELYVEDDFTNDTETKTNYITVTEAPAMPNIMFSEIADPGDEFQGRFVEIYNNSDTTINFDLIDVYFVKQGNGDNYSDSKLTGSVAGYSTFVIGGSSSSSYYAEGVIDMQESTVSGNGDDGYYLYFGGNNETGDLIDAYGVQGEDGSGKAWEYEDSRAYRKNGIQSANTTWTASEWVIESADIADMTPDVHPENSGSAPDPGNGNPANINLPPVVVGGNDVNPSAQITPNGNAGGQIQVQVQGQAQNQGALANPANVALSYRVSIPNGVACDFVFSFAGLGQTPTEVLFFNGANYEPVPGANIDGGAQTVAFSFTIGGRASTEFILNNGEGSTLPVELSSFKASPVDSDFISLVWETQSETALLGYDVYRAMDETFNNAVKLNASTIAGTNSSTTSNYRFDDVDAEEEMLYFYWLQSVDLDGTTTTYGPVSARIEKDEEESPELGEQNRVYANYPNPFNPTTTIGFEMVEAQNVRIDIYNARGQFIKTIFNEEAKPGMNQVQWFGKDAQNNDVSSGIYFYRLQSSVMNTTKKMILMK